MTAIRSMLVVALVGLGTGAGDAQAAPRRAARAAARAPAPSSAEAEKNRKAGEEFLARNARKQGVVTLESGLQYEIIEAGDGRKPTLHDTVVVHYRGRFIDGKEFGSSYAGGKPGTFPLPAAIAGWREALQLMPAGSKWRLFVPPHLAFGERGANQLIGPNQTLVFEAELLSVQSPADRRASAAGAVTGIEVAFKIDPRLTRSLWLGERWVSPARYTPSLQGKTASFEVSAHGVDAGGNRIRIEPEWIAADPEMVEVTRGNGADVTITVKRPGESKVAVAFQGVKRELAVKASQQGEAIAVEVLQ